MKERITRKEPGIVPFTKSYEELNERQQKFIDAVAVGYHKKKWASCSAGEKMTLAAAYESAGFTAKASKQAGWRLYMQTKHIIYKRRAELVELNLCPVMASEVVYEIMMDKKAPHAVRLKSAQDIMARTGFDKPQEIILTKKLEDMSEKELDEALVEALGGPKESNTESETTHH